MAQHLYACSFMLMILLSFGWGTIAQEEPPDEPDEAVVPVFDLTSTDLVEPVGGDGDTHVPVFDPNVPLGLSTTLGPHDTRFAFSQDFDDPAFLDGLVFNLSDWTPAGRTGKGLVVSPGFDGVPLQYGGVLDLKLQVDLALDGSPVQLVVKRSESGSYQVTLAPDGWLRLYKSTQLLAETSFTPAEWLSLSLHIQGGEVAIGVEGHPVIQITDPEPLPQGEVAFLTDNEGGGRYRLDNVLFTGVIRYPPPSERVTAGQAESLALAANPPIEPRLLLATYNSVTTQHDLYTIRPDGTGRQQVMRNVLHARWSRDGRKIAFVAIRNGSRNLFVMDAAGGNVIQVTNSVSLELDFSWSPDGRQIIFIRDGKIWRTPSTRLGGDTILVQTSNRLLSPTTRQVYQSVGQVDWSPDGRWILLGGQLLTSMRTARGWVGEIQKSSYIVDATGRTGRQVSTAGVGGRWSPDSRRILLAMTAGERAVFPRKVFIMDFATSTWVTLTLSAPIEHNWNQAWSPDGKEVVVALNKRQVTRVNARTGAVIGQVTAGNIVNILDWRGGTVPAPSTTIPDNANTLLFTSIVSPPASHLARASRLLRNASTSTLNRVSLSRNLYGACNSSHKSVCAKYSYLMFYGFFVEYTGRAPSLWDLFSAVYNGELGTYQGSQTSLQAFVRNFFDLQSGGCRYGGGGYSCTYDQLVGWLATSQFWIDRVKPSGTQMIVNVLGLTGEDIPGQTWNDIRRIKPVDTQRLHNRIRTGGMFNYDVKIKDAIMGNLTTWRSGQSPNHPSAWGNTVLPAGSTTYPAFNRNEQYDLVITHVFSNGKTTMGFNTNTNTTWGDDANERVVGLPLTPPHCTYISVITTTEGRLGNLSAC